MAIHKHDRKPHHLNRLKRQAEAGGGAEVTTPAGGKKGKGKGKDMLENIGKKLEEGAKVVGKAVKNAIGKIASIFGGKGKKKEAGNINLIFAR